MPKKLQLAVVVRNLPRRAHDLSRRTVMDSQRWRILEAMTEVTARKGYAETSVGDVIAASGVSRKTFYEHFDDKEDCFLKAYDAVSEQLIAALVAIGATHEDPDARLIAQVVAFVTAMARAPAVARVFVIDVLGAGPRALRRREQINRRFADAVLGQNGVDLIRSTAIIGGVNNVIGSALLDGRNAQLVELAGPLTDFIFHALGAGTKQKRRRKARGRDRT